MRKALLRIFLTLMAAGTLHSAHAQVFTFGPRLGINYSKLVVDKTFTSEGTDFTYATHEAKVGLLYGVFARLKAGPVFFQPELAFTQDKTAIEVSSVNFEEVQTLTVNKMDIPLLAGVKFGNTFKLMGGPVKSYVRKSKVRSPADMWDSYRQHSDEATWGYQVGVGLDIGRFMLDARYEGRLGPITNEATIGNQTFTFDHRQQTVQVSLGFMLVK